jgi:hypothetical protein
MKSMWYSTLTLYKTDVQRKTRTLHTEQPKSEFETEDKTAAAGDATLSVFYVTTSHKISCLFKSISWNLINILPSGVQLTEWVVVIFWDVANNNVAELLHNRQGRDSPNIFILNADFCLLYYASSLKSTIYIQKVHLLCQL